MSHPALLRGAPRLVNAVGGAGGGAPPLPPRVNQRPRVAAAERRDISAAGPLEAS